MNNTEQNLSDARESIAYNLQVDKQIECLTIDHNNLVQDLKDTIIPIEDLALRQIGLCDWFRTTKYYNSRMTDSEIIDRHNKIEEQYEKGILK